MRYLITGAGGNVGRAIMHHRSLIKDNELVAGVRKPGPGTPLEVPQLYFDFLNGEASYDTLKNIDALFLLRPPELADVAKIFKPLIEQLQKLSIKHIIFLSVQGAEHNRFIPHHKIETLIQQSGIPFTFIRPSYFMQNLLTALKNDIVHKNEIYLPAGNALFNWFDADDIGKLVAHIINDPQPHFGKAYTLTTPTNFTFAQVADMLSQVLQKEIRFVSPNLFSFWCRKRKEGIKPAFIAVMIMLHYLPRFGKPPAISNDFFEVMKTKPAELVEFIEAHRSEWI